MACGRAQAGPHTSRPPPVNCLKSLFLAFKLCAQLVFRHVQSEDCVRGYKEDVRRVAMSRATGRTIQTAC